MQPNLDFIIQLCQDAGDIIMEGFGKKQIIEYKGPVDLVTEYDRKSEDFIVDKILSEFPGSYIVAEESGLKIGTEDKRWYIDPIDGTSNYARGLPIFCVSIAYEQNGERMLAAVYDPNRDELFTAERGRGAFLNGEPIHVTDTSEMIKSLLVTGFPHDLDQENNNIREFLRIIRSAQSVRRLGSAVLDQLYVACGRLDGYWEVGISPWDIAAGTLIIEEAGGVVTRVNGGADYMKPPYDIVAANPVLQPKIRRELDRA